MQVQLPIACRHCDKRERADRAKQGKTPSWHELQGEGTWEERRVRVEEKIKGRPALQAEIAYHIAERRREMQGRGGENYAGDN